MRVRTVGVAKGVSISIGALLAILAISQSSARGWFVGEVIGALSLVAIVILLALIWIATVKHGSSGRKKGSVYFTIASLGFGGLCAGAVASSGAIGWHEIWPAWIAYGLFVIVWWLVPWAPRSAY